MVLYPDKKPILMKPAMLFPIICLLFACGPRPSNFEGGDASVAKQAVPVARFAEQTDSEVNAAERMLIRKGFMRISVGDVEKVRLKLKEICKDAEAYVSTENQSNYADRLEYEQVIRVPAADFDALVSKVESLAVRIENKNIETSDVTEEVIDHEARVKTKRELENRYREILKQAKNVSDILSIEAQLNNVRAEIESMEGRLNFLRNQIAFSTLQLTYYQPIGTQYGFASKTVAALGDGWEVFLMFLIGVLHIWPFLLIGALIVFLILRKSRAQKNEANTTAS